MLRLEDHWVWDSWYVQEENGCATRSSCAPPAPCSTRTSDINGRPSDTPSLPTCGRGAWSRTRSFPPTAPGWDDLATWTGSIVRGPDRRWYLFYTGVSRVEHGLVQRIGLATSDDLLSWRRPGTRPLLEPDPRWYETLDLTNWYEQAWRDPWVYPDPTGRGWHMLITARSNVGPATGRGVLGHATSSDLLTWTVAAAPERTGRLRPPRGSPGNGRRRAASAAVLHRRHQP